MSTIREAVLLLEHTHRTPGLVTCFLQMADREQQLEPVRVHQQPFHLSRHKQTVEMKRWDSKAAPFMGNNAN